MENTKKKNTFINRRIPLASMLYVKIAERFVTGKGMDCSVINKMSNKGDETPKLPLKDVLDFWEKAAVLIKDEALGLSIGINSHLTDYGMISHILMNSQNLYKALKLIDFYRYLMNECFESKLFCKGNIVHYKLDFTYEHPASYHLIEFHFSSIIHLGKQIARVNKKHDISPYKVEFSHAPKAPIKEYQRIFGENIKFNQNKNSLLFLNETLLISTHSPNEELYKHLLKKLDLLFFEEKKILTFYDKTYYLLNKNTQKTWPTLENIADDLHVSASTLKRRLKKENCNYQLIYDQVRFEKSKKLLLKKDESTSSIAYALGFSSASAFCRSFRRWSGLKPSDFISSISNASYRS